MSSENADEQISWAKLSSLEKSEYLVTKIPDCSFAVGINSSEIRIIESHKWILMSQSSVFNTMFNGNFQESQESINIPIVDVKADIFEKFLEYVYYKDKSKIESYSANDLIHLYCLGDKYNIEPLTNDLKWIFTFRWQTANQPSYKLGLLYIANKLSLKEQTDKISEIIKHEFKLQWILNYPDVYNWDWGSFLKLLELSKNETNEITRYKFIRNFIKNNYLDSPDLFSDVEQEPTQSDNKEIEKVDNAVAGTATNNKETILKQSKSVGNCCAANSKITTAIAVKHSSTALKNNRAIIAVLLRLVNYYKMTPKEFSTGPCKDAFLDTDSKLEILSTLCERI